MLIDQETVNLYQKQGVALVKKIISLNWIKKLKKGIKKNFENPSQYKCVYEKKNDKELFYDDYCNWQRIKEYKDFFYNSGIAEIALQLMQSKKVNIFHEHVLIKEVGASKRTPWHQDQSYYCINGFQNISFWIPLDNIPQLSCPEFVINSHKWNQKFIPTKFFGNTYDHVDEEFEKIPDIENNKEQYNIVSYDLIPGDAIAFNFATVHGAPGNTTKYRRRAFSARFTGDDATYIKRKGEMSPPFPEVKLKNGQPLDCDSFPVISV